MSIVVNSHGYSLLEFLNIEERAINDYSPLGSSFVVANYNDKYLLCFNIYRKQWELPAGRREQNESLRECAARELYEETSQRVQNLKFRGLIKVQRPNKTINYSAVYMTNLSALQPFQENEETNSIQLWDLHKPIHELDSVDKRILYWCIQTK